MYLLGHNAILTTIQAPAIPADPDKGIAGQPVTVRWSGTAQAYVDEDLVDIIREQGQRFTVARTLVDLPSNLPVWPNQEDLVTYVRGDVLTPYTQDQPQSETMVVRGVDGGFVMLGKFRLIVSKGG